jgi:cytochrome P450
VDAQHYLKAIVDKRRADPKDDIISGLIQTPLPEGRHLDDAEILSMLSEILVGGNETTTSAIGAGMKLMLDRPDVVERLRAEPGLMKNFVEEVLRLETPIQGLYRVTTRDVTLGGVDLPKGTPINMRWAAGNRDAATFPAPDELDLERRNAGSHVTFGSGIHHCLGATLARVEMASSFSAILDRLEGFRYADGFGEVEYLPSLLQRTIVRLPILFDSRT